MKENTVSVSPTKRRLMMNYAIRSILLLCLYFPVQAQMVHPGISHKKSDLERMKYQVEAGIEPWASTYELLKASPSASYNYSVKGNASTTTITNHSDFINDGFAAYYNALMWNITGDERHAKKCVEIFNAWVNIKRIEDQFPLNNGRGPWKMLEGAEIIRYTYDGWAEEDIQKFKDMLVYPGWSGTQAPTAAIASKDVSFYWNIYQGDPARHGNQGLFAYRSMMAMGIFCDNEIMYQRALRYLQGLPHLEEDLPYPSGPPVTSGRQSSSNEYYDEFRLYSRENTIEDYGYNEVMSNYIWENGQSQESSRDQAHALGGVSIITAMCEMAWSQGDDLYGHLDNRPLLGLEFYFRYNLSYDHSYPDQLEPWEPTAESGEFIQRRDRSGRWKSLKMNPYTGSNLSEEDWNRGKHNLNPIYEMNLGHYKSRMNVDASKTKWLERGFEILTNTIGVEDDAHAVDHPGWGGLKFHRVSPGDPISGFENGLPDYEMHVLPGTVTAANYDYFAINGEGHTYHDMDAANTAGKYRLNDGVDIDTCSEGGYCLTSLENEEWVTYTVSVPATALYNISISYAALKEGGTLSIRFDDEDKTGDVEIPFGDEGSTGIDDWKDLNLANDVILDKGVHAMKLSIRGSSNAFMLKHIKIEDGSDNACDEGLPSVETVSTIIPGVNYSLYKGAFDSLPDFSSLSPNQEGIADSISIRSFDVNDSFAIVFNAYIDIPIDGNFTFYSSSDEASRLYIDGELLVETNALDPLQEQWGSLCLNEGFHELKLEYFEKNGAENLKVSFEGPGVSKRALEDVYAIGPCENEAVELPENTASGINYYYYEGTWTSLPDFNTLTKVDSGTISSISLNNAKVADHFAFVFEGFINIEEDGDYMFYTISDDGSALYIDGELVVNNDGTHGPEEAEGALCLAKGYHQIRVEYLESTGGQSLIVQYEGTNLSRRSLNNFVCVPFPVKKSQYILFEAMPEKTVGDPDFTPVATASSGLPITFSSYRPNIASIVDNQIHIIAEGVVIILATQEGNSEFKPATASKMLTINPRGTSVDKVAMDAGILYPNPVKDMVTVQLSDQQTAQLRIFNFLGKQVFAQQIEEGMATIDMRTFESGVYLVNIRYNNSNKNYKLVKQ